MSLSLSAAARIEAQANFVLEKPRYTLTFNDKWDTVSAPSDMDLGANAAILTKSDGVEGVSLATCEPGTGTPNIDSVAAMYSAMLGATIRKGTSGTKTLGSYSVNWQEFAYDSLPVLSAIAAAEYGLTLRGSGTFRVYYLASQGYLFTIAGLRLLPIGATPYTDIESAISVLQLKGGDGSAVRPVVRRLSGGLWTRDGVLTGEWLQAHPALSVDCFTLSGNFVGTARPDGSAAWILPTRAEAMVVVVRARDGQSLSLLTQP